jgi:hypothetical protein
MNWRAAWDTLFSHTVSQAGYRQGWSDASTSAAERINNHAARLIREGLVETGMDLELLANEIEDHGRLAGTR